MTVGTTFYNMYDPTSLFAGADDIIHRDITYATAGVAGVVNRGTVMGRVSSGGTAGAASAVVSGGGVGSPGNAVITMDGTPVQTGAMSGTYKIVFTSATAYSVYDPAGDLVGSTTLGSASGAFNNQIKIDSIVAGNTAMVAGDYYTVAVAVVDKYIPCVRTATDGSQVPVCVSAWNVDVTSADVVAPAYFHGTFAGQVLIFDASWTYTGLEDAFRVNNIPIFVKDLGVLG